jgi:CelD/BcsL family acetyltransferase involved in cellulose biosynthesis
MAGQTSEMLMTRSWLNEQVTTRIIREDHEWDSVRRDWDDLYSISPTASTPLEFTWLRNWWHVYQSSARPGSLRIVTVWRATQLIGAVPLYLRCGRSGQFGLRRLGFISTGEAEFEEICPDYLNILCRPGEDVSSTNAIWRAIEQMSWDHLELLDLPECTPLLQCGGDGRVQCFSRGVCSMANLAGGFEAYLDRLTSNSRQQARRLLREGDRAGVQFEIVDVEQAGSAFEELIILHQERWNAEGKPGVFGAPRFVEFHRNLILQWLPVGKVILARLSLASKPVVVLYGFVSGRKFEFYQSGVRFEASDRLRSPGNLAHLLLMKALAGRGIDTYDFLRGSSSYKERLATQENRLVALQVWRPTLRTVVYRSSRMVSQLTRRTLRSLGLPAP